MYMTSPDYSFFIVVYYGTIEQKLLACYFRSNRLNRRLQSKPDELLSGYLILLPVLRSVMEILENIFVIRSVSFSLLNFRRPVSPFIRVLAISKFVIC